MIPFALSYRPAFTGLGIIAGYLAVLVGPSFYLRRRIGARRWRTLHRATMLVWVLSAVHTLGAGSDGSTWWLRAVVLVPVAPVVFLICLRILGTERRPAVRARDHPGERSVGRDRSRLDHRHEPLTAASEVSRSGWSAAAVRPPAPPMAGSSGARRGTSRPGRAPTRRGCGRHGLR
jgi:hypothetical protein